MTTTNNALAAVKISSNMFSSKKKFESQPKEVMLKILTTMTPKQLAAKWKEKYIYAVLKDMGLDVNKARKARTTNKARQKYLSAVATKTSRRVAIKRGRPINKTNYAINEIKIMAFMHSVKELSIMTGYSSSVIRTNMKNAGVIAPSEVFWTRVREGRVNHPNGCYMAESVWRKLENDATEEKYKEETIARQTSKKIENHKVIADAFAGNTTKRSPGRLIVDCTPRIDVMGVFVNKFCLCR